MPDTVMPERALIAAMLRRAWEDLASPDGQVRSDARAFWRSQASVQYWCDLVGLSAVAVQRYVATALAVCEAQEEG